MGTARSTIRALWRGYLDDATDVALPELTAAIVEDLLEDDEFIAVFAAECLPMIVYDIGQRLLIGERHLVRVGMRNLTSEQIKQSVRDELGGDRTGTWWEYVPGQKKHVALLEMTTEQVLEAARHRLTAGAAETATGKWLNLIAKRMQPGQRVREVWNEHELAMLTRPLGKVKLNGTAPVAQAAD